MGYETAQQYWLRCLNERYDAIGVHMRGELVGAISSSSAIREIVKGTSFEGQHLHVATMELGRHGAADVTVHCTRKKMPDRSYVEIRDQIFMASPEMSFVQAATYLSFARLVHYGCALCGLYALDEFGGTGISARVALTNRRKLKAFIDEAPSLDGSVLARRALKYVLEGSRSPRESTVAMILSLPMRYGGMGLPAPELNRRIEIPERLRNQTDRAWFEIDFLWEKARVAAEYDSDLIHATSTHLTTDAIKRNVLFNMGYWPFTFTRLQVNSSKQMDQAAEQLRVLLKVKCRKKPKNYEMLKAQLRRELGLPV